tara:strand:+ start:99 stop:230 length:132 start_codon:yes stop_codon:yes gene_type:complete
MKIGKKVLLNSMIPGKQRLLCLVGSMRSVEYEIILFKTCISSK